mmetsp:Transcript_43374/g.138441  ORF Transcript_43374/g.138441 Transcript_43374/m.138441 type:complete len:120 (-) Transcript_43374:45-404(-)
MSAAGGCARKVDALVDCQKKHPHMQEYVCRHLHQAAGWCLFSALCPSEVDSLESCGPLRSSSRGGGALSAGPHAGISGMSNSDRCLAAAGRLEDCLAKHAYRAAAEHQQREGMDFQQQQ